MSELDELKRWKKQAIDVIEQWEQCWVAAGSPGLIGQSKAANLKNWIEAQL